MEFVDSVPSTVRVIPGAGPASVSVEETPNAEFEGLVLAAVQERVTACATVPTNMDDVCPYGTRQKDLVSLTVTAQPSGFEDLSLTTFRSEYATITTQGPEFFRVTPSPRDSMFSVLGTISWEEGKPTVTVTDTGW